MRIRFLILTIFFSLLVSCFSTSYDLEEKLVCPALPPIKRVAVIPFFVPAGDEMGVVKEGKIDGMAAEKLATFTENKLKDFGCFEVVSWEEVLSIFQMDDKDNLFLIDRKDMKSFVINAGKKINADAVLIGYVTKYSERIGEKYGVSKPASVGFVMFLFSSKDGSILWTGAYRETQSSLSENLLNIKLFMKRGMKWLTADEIAKWGVSEVLKNFPGRVK